MRGRGGEEREKPLPVIMYTQYVCMCVHLVVCVELLVLPLTLAEGLPLGLQRLGQVGVLQALLGVLL